MLNGQELGQKILKILIGNNADEIKENVLNVAREIKEKLGSQKSLGAIDIAGLSITFGEEVNLGQLLRTDIRKGSEKALEETWRIVVAIIFKFLFKKEKWEEIGRAIVDHFKEKGEIKDIKIQPGIQITGSCPTGPVTGATTQVGEQLGVGRIE